MRVSHALTGPSDSSSSFADTLFYHGNFVLHFTMYQGIRNEQKDTLVDIVCTMRRGRCDGFARIIQS